MNYVGFNLQSKGYRMSDGKFSETVSREVRFLSTPKPMEKPRLEAKKKTVETKPRDAEKLKDVVEFLVV
jgi:hypothetical protein